MKSLSQAVAYKGWVTRPISILQAAQKLSLARPISLTILINKILTPDPSTPSMIPLSLVRSSYYIDAKYVGSISKAGIVKKVRNKGQYNCHLSHQVSEDPIRWRGDSSAPGEVKTDPWAGMYLSGTWKGNYLDGGQMPTTLNFEIEV